MITIYHNPRCSKSREGIQLLESKGKSFKVVKYLKELLDKEELKNLIEKLGIAPIELVRKNEAIWKKDYKNTNLTDDALIEIMVQYPNLIERTIVVNGDKAIVGRPADAIEKIL
ncbi:arsenate reductase (glutaredoxin) [Flavobacterium litorale]|uniref:Arsenate reductase (Glutaredoxin) n=1 Tax=Flavobacterium litorale TaxID=2856519 RepID=A0ABX8V420_9FLAO|nr:arsenate reductase (glutaredoxin) [Flavobacterium litorale]QYJ67594.1 arsenate reductase (glutaredoxin) [Flavobacterium litorale]